MKVYEQAVRAKEASYRLVTLSGEVRDRALRDIASSLDSARDRVLEANAADLKAASSANIAAPLLKRLHLDNRKIDQMIAGVYDLSKLEDPIGKILFTMELDSDLILHKQTVPIGLIGVIFESRPDALVQIATLCVKSGNAVILKGGTEARETNQVLFGILRDSLETTHVSFRDVLQLVESRKDIGELLELDELVDLVIPRGSSGLVRHIKQNTKIPVLGHAEGVCHLYIDSEADLDMAVKITYDAKCQYPAVCNALETLLIHEGLYEEFLNRLVPSMGEVELRGDERARAVVPMKAADEADWRSEYNDLVLAVRIVSTVEDGIEHINRYGSHHTDGIVTENGKTAEFFMNRVDSSSVMWNCSTRFADGYRFGFGAEVGVSTNKIHARGPVGLEGLTIYKYKLYGKGQTVAPYVAGTRKFTHRRLV
ncbi:MAG TPA: glutamate-5-semialdehyde dehydrogenase [Spirochaetia bacterium]|nr:glutamate-5-semialdehyde dehydrogenase [Spirochaetia bacterium]